MGMGDEEQVLKMLGLDFHAPDDGCCGMAGAFGFEKKHYDISLKVGERVLLPAVRQAASDTLILADGFSCREQIAQTTDRRALHLAQLLRMAMEDRPGQVASPETTPVARAQGVPSGLLPLALLGSAVALIGGVFAWILNKRK
jgi:hypothetical protein